MQDPKKEKPVRQPELPTSKNEPVQTQPANDRPIEGQGIDERARNQPADGRGSVQNK